MYTVKENEEIIAFNLTKKEVCEMLDITGEVFNRIVACKNRYKKRYKIVIDKAEIVLKNKELPRYLLEEWDEARLLINPNAKVEVRK